MQPESDFAFYMSGYIYEFRAIDLFASAKKYRIGQVGFSERIPTIKCTCTNSKEYL